VPCSIVGGLRFPNASAYDFPPDVTWNVPVVPSTISALTMGEDALVQNVYGPNTAVMRYGEIMEMTVVNWDAGKHPLCVMCHLHVYSILIPLR
jgi:iron transport multicopper oxidase